MNIARGNTAVAAAPPSKPSSQSFYRPELDAFRFAALKDRFTQVDSRPVNVSWAKSASIPRRTGRIIDRPIFTAISEERVT
jgi:hypothetical protein